jgi:surface protein
MFSLSSLSSFCKVTNMQKMFINCQFDGDLSKWNVEKVTSMHGMFLNAVKFDGDLSLWNTAKVTDMALMFHKAYLFTGTGLSSWNVGKVKYFNQMFDYSHLMNADLSKWDTSQATNMAYMFRQAKVFNRNISNWDVSSVTTTDSMFRDTQHFNCDISKVSTMLTLPLTHLSSSLTKHRFLPPPIIQWNIVKLNSMKQMFYGSEKFNQNVSTWDVVNINPVGNFLESFKFARSFRYKKSIDVLWGLKNVLYKNAQKMFEGSCAVDPTCGFCGKSSTLQGSSVTCSVAAQPRVDPFLTTPCFFCRDDGYECCNPTGCAPGSFRPADATQAVCIPMSNNTCPKGEGFSSASATGKDVFTGSTQDDGVCKICTKGKFKNSDGPEACSGERILHTLLPLPLSLLLILLQIKILNFSLSVSLSPQSAHQERSKMIQEVFLVNCALLENH